MMRTEGEEREEKRKRRMMVETISKIQRKYRTFSVFEPHTQQNKNRDAEEVKIVRMNLGNNVNA